MPSKPTRGSIPSIFCHFLTLVTSLLIAGLLSEADVLAPGVPSLGMRKPYLSVVTLTGVLATASDIASATYMRGQFRAISWDCLGFMGLFGMATMLLVTEPEAF